ncbi:MAG: hypothetical protein JXK05_05935 [Campylobacterales bacterium]|nr:hypothetical protein [Campylobacterales bacterium]
METSYTLSYKEQIEALREERDFEARGDALFMYHEDAEARLEWAFYRPSGSHPDQVSDPDEMVSIMAFNHSRLGALERFSRLHVRVAKEPALRVKIRNRSRMLFRAMVDDDFSELMAVLQLYPVFLDQACDQMMHGRIWNESYADVVMASRFLDMAKEQLDDALLQGVYRRLRPIATLRYEEVSVWLEHLLANIDALHERIVAFYLQEYTQWLEQCSLHPLQRIVLGKRITALKQRSTL